MRWVYFILIQCLLVVIVGRYLYIHKGRVAMMKTPHPLVQPNLPQLPQWRQVTKLTTPWETLSYWEVVLYCSELAA